MGMTTVKQDEMACAAGRQHAIYRVTIVGAVLNLVLIIFKMLAGILGRSGAMVADAIHSLSDFVTDVIVLVFGASRTSRATWTMTTATASMRPWRRP